jgi:hypothetical protein
MVFAKNVQLILILPLVLYHALYVVEVNHMLLKVLELVILVQEVKEKNL